MIVLGGKVRTVLSPLQVSTSDIVITARVKCSPDDTVGDLKKLIAAQIGSDWKKIQLKKWYTNISI